MLRRCRWWCEEGVENMVRVIDGFIKQLVIHSVAQFFKRQYKDNNYNMPSWAALISSILLW